MANYTVKMKASVYYETVIDTKEKWEAEEEAMEEFGDILDSVELPEELDWEFVEVWEVEKEDEEEDA